MMSSSVEEIMKWHNVSNWAEAEMILGFMDGHNFDSPMPSLNRSRSYRHGFANGRDDKAGKPRASGAELRRMAEEAIAADLSTATYCG